MIRKLLYSLLLFHVLFGVNPLFAQKQKSDAPLPCRDPKLPLEVLQEISNSSNSNAKLVIPADKPDSSAWKQNEIIIPLVVHVFGTHHNGKEVTADIVKDAIIRSNEDFRGETADWSDGSMSFRFDGIKEKLNITFKLARLDPNGNPTTGILFHQNEVGFGEDVGYDDKIRQYAWDNYKYCNLYIQNNFYAESGSAFYNSGVAWLPSKSMSDQNTSRVVYNGAYLGDNAGKNAYGENFRSILTHEFGHWLDLNHTFYSGCSSDLGHVGDAVDDTPPVNNNTNKPGETLNCRGEYINWQNFMDYTTQYAMFTEGQVAKMLDALDHVARYSLWQENNLIATGVLESKPPVAVIKDVKEYGVVQGEGLTFEDASINLPETIKWDLYSGSSSDGTLVSSGTEKNFSYTFNSLGAYTVILTATNSKGSSVDSVSIDVYTNLPDLPVSKISGEASRLVNINSNITFINESTGVVDSHKWTLYSGDNLFGSVISEGITSDFDYVFSETGIYTLALTTNNLRGKNISTTTINVYDIVSDFEVGAIAFCENAVVHYTANASEGVDIFEWTFEGGTPNTSTEKNPTVTYPSLGNHTVKLKVARNGAQETDEKTSIVPVVANLSPTESISFEIEKPLEYWTIDNPDNSYTWEVIDRSGYGSNNSLVMNNADNSKLGEVDMITSLPYDFTNVKDEMSFYVAYTQFDANSPDVLEVELSDDCGTTWTSVYRKTHTDLETVVIPTTESNAWFPSAENDWRKETLDISQFNGKKSVQFRFKNTSGYGTRIWIDYINFKLDEAIVQAPVAHISSLPAIQNDELNITIGDTVSFTDTSTNTPTLWSWKVDGILKSNSASFSYEFKQAKDYTVELTVTNSAGSDTKNILVKAAKKSQTLSISVVRDLEVDETAQVTVSGNETALSYTSSNPAFATVDASGLVTAVAKGNVVITVTAESTDVYNEAIETVSFKVTEPDVEPEDQTLAITSVPNLEIDETANLDVSGDMTTLTYTSSNESVATVSTSGVITAIAEGTTIITVNAEATAEYNAASSNISVTVNPAVVDPEDQTLAITSVPNLEIDETANLDVSGDMTTLTYTSSNESVATVSTSGVITAIAEGTTIITVNAEATAEYNAASSNISVTVNPAVVDPEDQTLAITSVPNLEIDETANLDVSGDMTTLTYTSSNESVATVSTSGVITAIAEGTVTITVNAEATAEYNAASSNISVTVNPAVVDPEDQTLAITSVPNLEIDETANLDVSGDMTTLTYTSSNESVATVSTSGVITAIAEGATIITVNAEATAEYNAASSNISVTVNPAVVDPEDQTLAITSVPNLEIDETANLDVSGDMTTLTYTSSNENVATVSTSGVITAIAEGTTIITVNAEATAEYNAASSNISVTVNPAVVDPEDQTLAITSVPNLEIGATASLNVTGAMTTLTYASSDESIATVNSSGVVSAISEGSATITANAAATSEYNAGSATVVVRVNPAVVDPEDQTLAITSVPNLEIDETANLDVSGDMTTLTYTSSNENVASVSTSGIITAIAEGTTIITVNAEATADYNAASSNISVTVNPAVVDPEPEDQTLVIASISNLEIDETANLNVSGDMTSLTYTSSNENVAKVDANGLVTAVAEGEVTITVTAERTEKYNEATVEVTINVISNTVLTTDDFNLIVEAYPNPTNGRFNLSLPKSFKYGSMEVVTLLGTTVRSFEIKDKSFDLRGLNPGTYYLKVVIDGEVSISKLTLK